MNARMKGVFGRFVLIGGPNFISGIKLQGGSDESSDGLWESDESDGLVQVHRFSVTDLEALAGDGLVQVHRFSVNGLEGVSGQQQVEHDSNKVDSSGSEQQFLKKKLLNNNNLTKNLKNLLNNNNLTKNLDHDEQTRAMTQEKTCGICDKKLLLLEFGNGIDAEAAAAGSTDFFLGDDSPWPFKDCGPVCSECYDSHPFKCIVEEKFENCFGYLARCEPDFFVPQP